DGFTKVRGTGGDVRQVILQQQSAIVADEAGTTGCLDARPTEPALCRAAADFSLLLLSHRAKVSRDLVLVFMRPHRRVTFFRRLQLVQYSFREDPLWRKRRWRRFCLLRTYGAGKNRRQGRQKEEGTSLPFSRAYHRAGRSPKTNRRAVHGASVPCRAVR